MNEVRSRTAAAFRHCCHAGWAGGSAGRGAPRQDPRRAGRWHLRRPRRAAARRFGTPVAKVRLVDADRVFLAACHSLAGARQVGTEPGRCASAILGAGPSVGTDARTGPRTLHHPLVRGQLGSCSTPPRRSPPPAGTGWRPSGDGLPATTGSPTQITVLALRADVVARHLDLRLTAIHTYTRRDQPGPLRPPAGIGRGRVERKVDLWLLWPRQYLTCGRVQP